MPDANIVTAKTIVRRHEDIADAFITVDLGAIAMLLGPKAMRAKGKLATALEKAVTVEVRNIRKLDSEFCECGRRRDACVGGYAKNRNTLHSDKA